MNKITIVATNKESVITLDFNGKTYERKCILTPTGARYEGFDFETIPELPDFLLDELEGFTAYNLARALERTKKIIQYNRQIKS